MVGLPLRTSPGVSELLTLNTPTFGRIEANLKKRDGNIYRIDFTLRQARIPITDGAGSGSHGSLKLCDFAQGAISFLGCRQDYTRNLEAAALSVDGDAVYEIGVGTTAISAAADGTLGNGVNENVGQAVAITSSSFVGTGTAVDGTKSTALNGTASALALYLNWSGTAATVEATSSIDITGTISVSLSFLGDD